MPVEIERKFLVVGDEWQRTADTGRHLRQGYILRGSGKAGDSPASVRVRLADGRAWLSVKSAQTGISRDEFEYEIPVDDGAEMLTRLCVGPVIEKTRYQVSHGGLLWEVDVFAAAATGLVLAEVELNAVDQPVDLPEWVGAEVTDDPRFRNAAIGLSVGDVALEQDGA